MTTTLTDRMARYLRADVQGMHGYAVQPSAGLVKVDTMENPFRLPPGLRRELGERLAEVALTMSAFGAGAALPLLAVGVLSRETMIRMRGKLASASTNGKFVLGGLLMLSAVFILTGFDKDIETKLLELSPAWLTNLTTSV